MESTLEAWFSKKAIITWMVLFICVEGYPILLGYLETGWQILVGIVRELYGTEKISHQPSRLRGVGVDHVGRVVVVRRLTMSLVSTRPVPGSEPILQLIRGFRGKVETSPVAPKCAGAKFSTFPILGGLTVWPSAVQRCHKVPRCLCLGES